MQNVEDGTPIHEAMMASSAPASSLNSALDFGHDVNSLQENVLTSDKMLVGALDSACNRTCSGELRLELYLKKLNDCAPAPIRSLVKSVPESEMFRFGNGGTKASYVRYRLPMMVGSTLVLVWVSIVAVPSLGLLLGREFLDAIGAVISFSQKMMRADYLDGSLVRLRQIMAGHFALLLAPPRWQLPGALRWKRSGLAGVVEVQVSAKQWFSRKFEALDVSRSKETHGHLVSEQGVAAADVIHSGSNSDDELASQLLAHRAQAMLSSDNAAVLSSTTSSASPTSRSSLNASGHGRPRASSFQQVSTMGKVPPSNSSPSKMARSRPSLVALAATIAALCALSVSQCEDGGSMAAAVVASRSPSRIRVSRALQAHAFTAKNLHNATWLRNQVGLQSAFLEDGLLTEILAARSQKGTAQLIRRAALQEAQKEAQVAIDKGPQVSPRQVVQLQWLGPSPKPRESPRLSLQWPSFQEVQILEFQLKKFIS